MSQNKKTPLGDEEVMTLVNSKVKECVGWFDSRLSKERQRVINYYNSELPKRQHTGSASYVSTDVYDSVESMKAQILETFSANPDNLVSFTANGPEDVEASRVATEYCNYIVFRENDGYGIFSHIVHDGLTARNGVVKASWAKKTDDCDEELPAGATYQDVQSVASQKDVTALEADADEGSDPHNPTFTGTLTRSKDCSKVDLDPVPPEEFLIVPRAPSVRKADLCSHRTLKTKAELKALGYDPKKVDELHYDSDKGLDLGPEAIARNSPIETAQSLDNPIQPETEKVMLYESYARMDMRDGKGVRLYKICHVNDVLFEKEEVDCSPFYVFTPLPIPYMFYGNNFAARVIPTQNARTVLTRAILDHASITTNPRWGVVKGGLLNPKEMIENRLGGILNLTRPDAVKPLEQANLNPYIFQTLGMLKENKEESTGISALSQGMNKDAISTQNSSALVDNLVTLSQTRQKIIARNFASFLVELYLAVYKLVLDNQDKEKEKIIEVAGAFVPVKTEDWVERTTCTASIHLGYGERDRQTAKYEGLYQKLTMDPAMAGMFKPQNRYKLATDGMRSAGFQNYAEYISPPEAIQPPQPDPIKMQELQIKDKEAQAALITAQSLQSKTQHSAEIADLKEQLAQASLQLKAQVAQRTEDRKDADVSNKINTSQRQTKVLEHSPMIQGHTALRDAARNDAEVANKINTSQRETAVLEKTPVTTAGPQGT
jgi:hypothetical protein